MSVNEFDERAKAWDEDAAKVERARAVAAEMRRRVPLSREMKALEYGCGTGLLSFELYRELGPITLADNSEGMLEVLRGKIAAAGAMNMQAVRLDLTEEAPLTERFDLVYSLLVLHHVEDTRRLLDGFHQALRPQGILCICDLDREDGSFHDGEFHGHLGFDRDALAGMVREAGFEEAQLTTAHEIYRHGRRYPLFLLTARRSA
jgi:2-polyprenyl-3-methyl-5-hydroxy-6-metoxy-1,4-benzoquinol methylase